MPDQWYLARGKEKLGPYTTAQMRNFAATGKLFPSDMVMEAEAKKWGSASSLFFVIPPAAGGDLLQAHPPQPSSPHIPAASFASRIKAKLKEAGTKAKADWQQSSSRAKGLMVAGAAVGTLLLVCLFCVLPIRWMFDGKGAGPAGTSSPADDNKMVASGPAPYAKAVDTITAQVEDFRKEYNSMKKDKGKFESESRQQIAKDANSMFAGLACPPIVIASDSKGFINNVEVDKPTLDLASSSSFILNSPSLRASIPLKFTAVKAIPKSGPKHKMLVKSYAGDGTVLEESPLIQNTDAAVNEKVLANCRITFSTLSKVTYFRIFYKELKPVEVTRTITGYIVLASGQPGKMNFGVTFTSAPKVNLTMPTVNFPDKFLFNHTVLGETTDSYFTWVNNDDPNAGVLSATISWQATGTVVENR